MLNRKKFSCFLWNRPSAEEAYTIMFPENNFIMKYSQLSPFQEFLEREQEIS